MPFDGTGVGRAWPLLVGERGHYELSAGRDPLPYLQAMAAMAGPCGLIPEQVWDGPPLPERGLAPGRPTGSAMPLVWAHAEFAKLAASRALGRPFDRPEAVWQRYRGRAPTPALAIWSLQSRIMSIRSGQVLCVLVPGAARVHYGIDGWNAVTECASADTGLGQQVVQLPSAGLPAGSTIDFTLFWVDAQIWDGHDHHVDIV